MFWLNVFLCICLPGYSKERQEINIFSCIDDLLYVSQLVRVHEHGINDVIRDVYYRLDSFLFVRVAHSDIQELLEDSSLVFRRIMLRQVEMEEILDEICISRQPNRHKISKCEEGVDVGVPLLAVQH